jgi:hypothetical protein
MNYKNIYHTLITRGKERKIESEYKEIHHIIPRCLGGSDEIENLVELTPEEHYVAHQLLIKIYPDNHSLIYAARMMIVNRPSNKLYGWLRRKYAEAVSINQTAEGNSQHGTKWITNLQGEQKKIEKSLVIPEGWVAGRKKLSTCKYCNASYLKITNTIFCSVICKSSYTQEILSTRMSSNNPMKDPSVAKKQADKVRGKKKSPHKRKRTEDHNQKLSVASKLVWEKRKQSKVAVD